MQQNYNKKRKLNKLKRSLLLLVMVLFAGTTMAQVPDIFMRDGSYTIDRSTPTANFYDSHGGSRPHNYWERWYNHGEEFTFTFKPQTEGDKIKVTFNLYTAYGDPTDPSSTQYQQMQADPQNYDGVSIGQWALRLNDDILRIYDGETTAAANMIAEYTGNTQTAFTVMTDGPITFYFKANTSYREEGWCATVELQQGGTVAPQAPFIRRSTCSDEIEILPTTLNPDHIYYTIDGTTPQPGGPNPQDPLNTTQEYTGTTITWPAGQNMTVKAISVIGSNYSSTTSVTFYDKTILEGGKIDWKDRAPVPGTPTIAVDHNVVTMTPATKPAGLNDTYQVRYTMTTDGSTPAVPDQYSTLYTGPITCSVAGTKFRAKTVALTCSNQISTEYAEATVTQIYAPEPVIDFGDMTITAKEGDVVYDILYTLDGSMPSVDPMAGSYSATTVSLTGLTAGQTVRALAYRANNDSNHTPNAAYHASDVVAKIYIPEGGSGTYSGGIVLLDDREPHTWSYYTSDSPIHSLKPADVKITYFGYGEKTMTGDNTDDMPTPYYGENSKFNQDVDSDKVAVNVGEEGNQFIYLKTLENAKEDGSGNYPYTMIPNPFQVRPINGEPSSTQVTTYNKVTSSQDNWEGTYIMVYESGSYAFNGTISNGTGGRTSVTINNGVISNPGSSALLTVVKNGDYYFVKNGNNNLGVDNSNNLIQGTSTGNQYQWSLSVSNGIVTISNRNWTNKHFVYNSTYSGFYPTQNVSANICLYKQTSTSVINADWRGFYAWRVKRLSNGLSIQDPESKATYGVGDIIYADQEVEFVAAANSTDNEVDFEALWAKAYVNSSTHVSNSGNYKNAYERNFKVGTSITTYNYPVTFSTLNPDGSGTAGSISVGNDYTCSNPVKFENVTLTTTSTRTLAGAGYDLFFGRGINTSGTFNIYGRNSNSTEALRYTIRIETGSWNNLYFVGLGSSNGYNVTYREYGGLVSVKGIVGCDYDRVKTNNSKLNINGEIHGAEYVQFSSANNRNNLTVDYYIKSGTLQSTIGNAAAENSFYMGFGTSQYYHGKRRMTVEGGSLTNIAGGIDNNDGNTPSNYYVNDGTPALVIRMKGGTVRGVVYGAAQFADAGSDRRFVFTGGTIAGWIAGGCNGTNTTGGELYGDTYIYFGGKAKCDSNGSTTTIGPGQATGGNIFGAGSGNSSATGDDATVGRVNSSTIVVADEAVVERNVYGGGNYGYVRNGETNKSDLYVLGGTVKGSMFGGSNMQKGQNVNIWVKGGVVEGNVYGGSNTQGTINYLATVNMSGGTVTNVFGGGYGISTNMAAGTKVTVSGGTVSNNVYGGGEEGTVASATEVTVSGGSVKDVYGAGKGSASSTAQVYGGTKVNVSGGTVNGAVYGGGEAGDVMGEQADPTVNTETVTIDFEDNSYSDYLTSTGNYAWERSTTNPQGGSYCFRSTNYHVNSSTSSFSMTYDFPVAQTISFYYKVSSESSYDYLRFYVDGTQVQQWAGTVSWTQYTHSLTAGSHTLTWTYYKDNSTHGGDDRAWVDNITFTKVASVTPGAIAPAPSVVAISGGTISGDVFGGGKMGKSVGNTTVTVSGGILRMNVFGGAYGEHGSVYLAGLKTVNIMGGRIYGSVYGGSRNANDALALTGYDEEEDETCSITNVSGGQIEQHVYAAGYYGQTYGSVYAFVGLNAINDAPNTQPTSGLTYIKRSLVINGNVWAGGDWGTFSGTFGDPTVSGNSNIYVDGTGYSTDGNDASVDNYMNINGSVYGCGTSCDAGNKDRDLIIRNYGADVANTGSDAEVNPVARATRQFTSLQRFHNIYVDNVHVGFVGQGKINSLNNTEKYSIYEIDENIYFANGSTFVMNAPSSQLKSFHSVTLGDVYNDEVSTYSVVSYNGLGSTSGASDNKIRVNGGSYIEIKYTPATDNKIYGQLEGFCHMMTSNDNTDETCAYARPKQSKEEGNRIPGDFDNANDGGFVAYRLVDNTYTADGTLVSTGSADQLRYENHTTGLTKNGEQYYRIWRYGGKNQMVEAVLNAEASGTSAYKTVEVTVQLPSWDNNANGYFKFASTGTSTLNTLIDYGSQVMTFNAANYKETISGDNTWMYYNGTANATATLPSSPYPEANPLTAGLTDIEDNPNLNFGLVLIPGQAMTGNNYIICSEADGFLASQAKPFVSSDITHVPTITLRLTYRDDLSANTSLDPMYIPLVQYDKNDNIINNVTIKVQINTSTNIASGLRAKVYARMIGASEPKAVATASVVLPTFEVYQSGEESHFTLKKVEFKQGEEGVALGVGQNPQVQYTEIKAEDLNIDRFALSIKAAPNPDNTDDWRFDTGEQDGVAHPSNMQSWQNANLLWGESNDRGVELGQAGGRSALTLDFNLYYNSNVSVNDQTQMGEVVFTIEFDNYKYGSGENHTQTFTVTLEVYRIGKGKNFYVAGTGLDKQGRGKYPDTPAKTVNYIFNRCGFLPGDNIFVVDNLPINTGTTWDGSVFQNEVNIYRYPGAHGLSGTTQGFENVPYLGALVSVNKELTMKGITMDGIYAEATATEHNINIYPTSCDFNGKANKPLIEVLGGGRLNLTSGTVMQNNYSTVNGGAVSVAFGGVLAMNQDAEISNNHSEQLGAGVYMDGAMIVSDYVKVYDNKKGTDQSNIWLTEAEEETKADTYKVIQVGTSSADAYGELKKDEGGAALLGVDKDDWGHSVDGFMPVVYAETGTEGYLELPYAEPQTVIVHDRDIYTLRKYLSPNYLYWIFTWVEAVTSKPDGFAADNIDTPEELAWAISIVNGENDVEGTADHKPGQAFVITDDIDMSQYIWVPIGSERFNYSGTFEGNGHVVTGLRTSISEKNVGMFGTTNNATIKDMVVNASFSPAADNVGTVIGTMNGGTLSNVEGAGSLENKNEQGVIGGLVGTTSSASTIHSAFAVPTIKGGKNMGGLVGINAGKLYNSYVNASMTPANNTGGLVAVNEEGGEIENCYVVVGTQTFPAFANTNNGKITICYTDKANDYVKNSGTGSNVVLSGHGTYDVVKGRKETGYMYGDNAVSATNDYVATEISYKTVDANNNEVNAGHITKWPGLLSTLNQWVVANPKNLSAPTSWLRPTSANINGDLPVLCFPKDNSMGTEDGKFLKYSAFNLEHTNTGGGQADAFNNGLDGLLEEFNALEDGGDIFLYGNATEVANVPGTKVNVTINEDAVLLQAANAGDFINTTVGVTFDNSCKTAGDYIGNTLTYDWHFMSSALQDAPINTADDYGTPHGVVGNPGDVNIEALDPNCYFPNGLTMGAGYTNGVKWDFYTYYEPEYHWINLKRNDHWHQDTGAQIDYENETIFEPGKGYMMAISQDSYMNSTGKLNKGGEKVTLYNMEKLTPVYNKGWNLVGNPYQAYLDLSKITDRGDFYIYDADQGVFAPVTNGQSTNPCIPSLYIHPHQGFFMHIKDSEQQSEVFTFNYDWATATKDGASYFRGSDDRINYPLVNIFAENERGNRDLAVVEFNRPELGGATKVNSVRNANFQIAASLEGQRYGLVFTPEGTERVPVHFITEEDGTFTLTWNTQNGDFTSLLLVDNMTGTITDMLRADRYTFDASTEDYASRFYLTYTVTGVDEYNEGDGSFAFFDGSEWVVNGKGQLDIVDVTGRVLFSKRLANERNRVSLNGVANGVYLMRVTDGKNTMVQKIVVK